MNQPFDIIGASIPGNTKRNLDIPISRLPTGSWTSIPLVVIHGKRPGPKIWLTAAIHGDEINGVEIIRRVVELLNPNRMQGTVIAVPIVNIFGFIQESRYLPDRRDLNRSFPGSSNGSLASRIANILMKEVISKCEYGIDLHTGSNHRHNLPQIRADLTDKKTKQLAKVFRTPVIIHSHVRDHSLREAATNSGIKTLLYEGGEPHRFNEVAIHKGVEGILRVLNYLNIISIKLPKVNDHKIYMAQSTQWIRARKSGLIHHNISLGMSIKKGQELGTICNTFGEDRISINSPVAGIVIGINQNPIVNKGDAFMNVAKGKYVKS